MTEPERLEASTQRTRRSGAAWWAQIRTAAEAVLELPLSDRAAFLDHHCADDAELREAVAGLVDACERAQGSSDFLRLPAIVVAGALIPDGGVRDAASESAHDGIRILLQSALVGRYTIEREIGRGGMAVVYLAHDHRHARRVALKVLSPELGAMLGAERFLAEIQVTANLQHPHLLPLFDSGETGGLLYYTMPYVAGESLRARLARERQLPVDESVHIATAAAGALDYAHRRGVVHRDLKPENILLHEGQPLVADFGIALAVSESGRDRLTLERISLGTPQYMSPEQAAGSRTLDGRSDVYSLACVLYEMLSGEPPHTGSTVPPALARALGERPRLLRSIRPSVPASVEAALERALATLPADRYATAREFADALRGMTPATVAASPIRAPMPNGAVISWQRAAIVLGILATLSFATSWHVWRSLRTLRSPVHARFLVSQSDTLAVEVSGRSMSLSSDGSALAYVGAVAPYRIYVRSMDELQPTAIAGAEGGVDPQISADGRWLAFLRGGSLRKVPIEGGAAETIADSVDAFSWGDSDTILLVKNGSAARDGLWRIFATGGSATQVARPRLGTLGYGAPELLPGSRAALFTVVGAGYGDEWQIVAARLDDGRVVPLGIHGSNPHYLSGGFVVYGRGDGTLFAVPFDAQRLKVTGPPVQVLRDVVSGPGGISVYAVSRSGSLAYLDGSPGFHLVEVDRQGRERSLLTEPARYIFPRVAPDGQRIAVAINDDIGRTNVWIYDIVSATLTRLTDGRDNTSPAWTRDGRRLAWTTTASGGVVWQAWDAGTPPQRLTKDTYGFAMTAGGDQFVTDVRPDGVESQIVSVSLDSSRRRARVVGTLGGYSQSRLSPDGRWLAYVSAFTGRSEVYVQPFPGPGGVRQISTNGGVEPVWAPTGRELFFRVSDRLVSATLTTGRQLDVLRRDTLFRIAAPLGTVEATYDVFPDGEHFVFSRLVKIGLSPVMAIGWADGVRAKLTAVNR